MYSVSKIIEEGPNLKAANVSVSLFSGDSQSWTSTQVTPAYTNVNLRNLELQHDNPSTGNIVTLDLVEEMPNLLLQGPSTGSQPHTPVSRTPGAGASYETYFIPSSRLLMGCIEEPKGRPLYTGGYSDVWQCTVRFFAPSEALPAKVSL